MSSSEDEEDVEYVEEEEEEEEYEEIEEEEEDESEPMDLVKYETLKLDFLHTEKTGTTETTDSVCCMAVGKRFLVIGTQQGWLHVVDFNGNEIKQYQHHYTPISDISVDRESENVGACSTDGRVSVGSIYGGQLSCHINFDRPVSAIAIDPEYGTKQRFITGGSERKLILVDKSFILKRWQQTVLSNDQQKIHAIKWHGNLVAWADDKSVKIYDVNAKTKIIRLERERQAPPADLYRCNLVWEGETTLLIAWANWIAICEVKPRISSERVQDPSLPDRAGEVRIRYRTRYFISGVAPFGTKLLFLTYPADSLDRPKGESSPKPEIRILDRDNGLNQIEMSTIKIEEYEHLLAKDYHMTCDEYEDLERIYYILSPKQIAICRPCDTDDRVSWYIKNRKYEEALLLVKNEHVNNYTTLSVGEKYLVYLVDTTQQYEKAASLLKGIIGTNLEIWLKWIHIFREKKQLECIIDKIPIGGELNLGQEVYEMILHYFLWGRGGDTGARDFYEAIKKWPSTLYRATPIINSAKQLLEDLIKPDVLDPPATAGTTMEEATSPDLENSDPYSLISVALAMLYENQNDHQKALEKYLLLGRSDVFGFIERHNLQNAVANHVVQLLWKNQARALSMLTKNHNEIKVSRVVEQLSDRKVYLYRYLDLLHKEDTRAGLEYHDLLIELYAEFAPSKLLPYLRRTETAQLTSDNVADVCVKRLKSDPPVTEEEAKQLYRVQAYVLGRLGERAQALEILISRIQSVKESIAFIVDHDDEDLFETLVQACLDGGKYFIADLLEHIGDAEGPTRTIEPLNVFNRIQEYVSCQSHVAFYFFSNTITKTNRDMEIPGLKDKLIRIMSDQALRKYLKQGCLRVLEKDVSALGVALRQSYSKGVIIDTARDNPCLICDRPIALQTLKPQGVVAFLCGHSFHKQCYYNATGKSDVHSKSPEKRKTPKIIRIGGIPVRGPTSIPTSYLGDSKPRCPTCNHAQREVFIYLLLS